jgi:predicted amidophosphoribosyltransferase
LHPARRASRGYDQAALIAKWCGRWWGIPVLPLLRRVRETRPQARLDPGQRRTNTAGAFGIDSALAPIARDRPLLLIDDVATTGATLLSAADALEPAGPAWILALTASHGGAFDTAQSTAHAKVATPGVVC